ncbi:MAG: hypothetical protein ABI353_20755 [Isosphaeraceae bacterium]
MVEPPKDVFGPVAADAEVGRVPRAIVALPDGIVVPPLGDRVAEEEQVDVPLLGPLEERLVHRRPNPRAGHGLGGGSADVLATGGNRHEIQHHDGEHWALAFRT